MTPSSSQGGGRDWLLDDLVGRVAQIGRAAFLTPDGLATGAPRGLPGRDAGHLAALAAGYQSLARGAGPCPGGGQARQTITEMVSLSPASAPHAN